MAASTKKPSKGAPRGGASRSKKPAKDSTPIGGKVARNLLILRRRSQEWPWAAIAEEVGLSEKRCREIAKRGEHVPGALEQDPVEIVESMLRELDQIAAGLAGTAVEAENGATRVGAFKAMADVLSRKQDLLTAVGKLDEDLSGVGRLRNFRMLVDAIFDVLDRHGQTAIAAEVVEEIATRGGPGLVGSGE